jgi:hypothetical protein
MPVNFPLSPATNDLYSYGNTVWKYNGTAWVVQNYAPESVTTNIKTFSIGAVFDGGGALPTVDTKSYVLCPNSGTLSKSSIFADITGSAQITVYRNSSSSYPPSTSIVGSLPPSLSGQNFNQYPSLTGWSTSVTAGDIFGFKLDSVTGCTRITVQIECIKS